MLYAFAQRSFRFGLPLLVLFAGLASACQSGDTTLPDRAFSVTQQGVPGEPTAAEEDSALALLQRLQPQTMQGAFDVVELYDFTRHLRTEQFDGEMQRIAARERTVHYAGPPGDRQVDLVSERSTGQFSFGWLNRFVSRNEIPDPVPRAGANLLSEDPAYLSPRNRDQYQFRLGPDTTLAGRRARLAEVQLHPDAGESPGVQHARFYVDSETDQVLAFSIIHVNETLLFDEASRFEVELQLTGEDWVPRDTRFRTRVQLPFAPVRTFETSSVYSNYRLSAAR